MRTKHAHFQVPAVMAVTGSAIALASLIGSGWSAALSVELFTVIATIGYCRLGRRDSDLGAMVGSRPDERQASIGLRATALAGNVMGVVAVGGVVIATALGASTWPFALFAVVGAASFLVGSVIFRG
jgi:hypothetical protein